MNIRRVKNGAYQLRPEYGPKNRGPKSERVRILEREVWIKDEIGSIESAVLYRGLNRPNSPLLVTKTKIFLKHHQYIGHVITTIDTSEELQSERLASEAK